MNNMNDNNSIAILLSTYNGEKFLNQQLQSLANQRAKNFTVFVRDDMSSDNTIKILQKWKSKIKINILPSDKNLGPAKSFMVLANKCGNYKYYAFCDQDDVWDEDKLEVAVEKLKDIDEPCLYFCNSRTIDSNGNVIHDDQIIQRNFISIESEIVCGFCPGCAMVFNDALMNLIRNQHYDHIVMHDMVFIMNAFVFGKVIYDSSSHFSRRMHSENVVGREGKNLFGRFKQTYRRWFNNNSITMDVFVSEFLTNIKNSTFSTKIDVNNLYTVANYRRSMKNKAKIIRNHRFDSYNKRARLSFNIRTILNLL